MLPKDAYRMGNSVDSDQTAPFEVIRFGSTLFSQDLSVQIPRIKNSSVESMSNTCNRGH